jgi:hypothetical protein
MKALQSLALAGVMLAHALLPAKATPLVIQEDNGGVIVNYIKKYSGIRDSGETVIVDGGCFSACTLFLGLVPKEKYCLTDRAILGFHSATERQKLPSGKVKVSHATEFSALMFNIYPAEVRRMLKLLGWDGDQPEIPHPEIIAVEAHQLTKIARKCTDADWRP